MTVASKQVSITTDDSTDLNIGFYLGGAGPTDVWARITVAPSAGPIQSFTCRVEDVPYTVSGVTASKVKQVLKDVRTYALAQLGFV